MLQTPREIVRRALTFDFPERMPRDLWLLPWAEKRFPEILKEIREKYPNDIINAPDVYRQSSKRKGEQHGIGTYVDEWGCVFVNVQDGVIGKVKNPIMKDIADLASCNPPYEILPDDYPKAWDIVNRFCDETDRFVLAPCCPRPWERMQFLRGTENALTDIVLHENESRKLLDKIHEFYMTELKFWVSSNVDAIFFMDDWGSQANLLISPDMWRQIFKPLYRDYCETAHAEGKFAFMHSDGCISSIYEDLIDVCVDALNSQLFTMDMEYLSKVAKGKITFWGEIDRQHVLPSKDPEFVRKAVREVAKYFYDPKGGIINQLEFGAGAHGPNALIIFEEWERIEKKI